MKIKDATKIEKVGKIRRQCVICGKYIVVTLYPGGKYSGGNYFGNVASETKSKAEYWECEECYN